MADKLDSKALALALAAVSGISYVLCAVLFAIAPAAALGIFRNLFHGIDIGKIAGAMPLENALAGFVEIIIMSLIAGWAFAAVYNYLLAKAE